MFRATFECGEALTATFGELTVMDAYPPYEGTYEVTPREDGQVLGTAGRRMDNDVTVHGVPYYETSNEFGTTVNIGG